MNAAIRGADGTSDSIAAHAASGRRAGPTSARTGVTAASVRTVAIGRIVAIAESAATAGNGVAGAAGAIAAADSHRAGSHGANSSSRRRRGRSP